MAIPTDTAGLAIAIAAGLLKLSQRVDDIAAEERATQGDLAFPMIPAILPPRGPKMVARLHKLLRDTEGSDQAPQGDERDALRALLEQDPPNEAGLVQGMERYASAELVFTVDDPAARTRTLLGEGGRAWDLRDQDILRIAYYVGPGGDLRKGSLSWKLAMALVDVLAEFVVENQEFVLKDERARGVVSVVLTRFSAGDLEDEIPDARALLHHTLRSTLNGMLDARDLLDADLAWLESILGALSTAREQAEVSDDFLVGLLKGKGYRLLVRAALEEGTGHLSRQDARAYEKILAQMVGEAARRMEGDQSNFKGFFEEHWSDLARAGLRGLHSQAPVLLDDQAPILRETLVAAVAALAEETNRDLLGRDTLIAVVEAAVDVVATKPELLDGREDASWLRDVVGSLTGVVQQQGLERIISRRGLELLLRDALMTMGENPELLIREPDLPQKLVGSVLRSVAQVEGSGLDAVATAAVLAALDAVADNPELIDLPYAEVVGSVARAVAARVVERKLTGLQAGDLVESVAAGIAANPELFLKLQKELAREVVDLVLRVADDDPAKLLAGAGRVILAREIVFTLSARGLALLDGRPLAELRAELQTVLEAGLAAAAAELGQHVNRPAIPVAIGQLIDAWSRGEVPVLDPDDADFVQLFTTIADSAMREVA